MPATSEQTGINHEFPEAFMLCGLAGSGKTTYAEELVARGAIKLSLDEGIHEKFGQAGVDYPIEDDTRHEQQITKEQKEQLAGYLAIGQSVVLDYGFLSRDERDEYKKLIEDSGGRWRLLYLKANLETIRERLTARAANAEGANAQPVNDVQFQNIINRFEEPRGEGEEIIEVG